MKVICSLNALPSLLIKEILCFCNLICYMSYFPHHLGFSSSVQEVQFTVDGRSCFFQELVPLVCFRMKGTGTLAMLH